LSKFSIKILIARAI